MTASLLPWSRNIPPASKYPTIFSGTNTHVCQVVSRGLSEETVEDNCNLIVKAVNSHEKMRELLVDAAVMLSDIERNREMPPFAETLSQYVALGKAIKEFLQSLK
jgi:hypothetical protein